MDTMDLQVAAIAHLQWKSKLSDFFYGVEELTDADVPDHTSCDFGKWLYSTGLQAFASFPEINALEALHKDVHADIKRLVAMPKATRTADAGKQALTKFKGDCDRLVHMIEAIQRQAEKR